MVESELQYEEEGQVQENNHKEQIDGSHFRDKEISSEQRTNTSKVTDLSLAKKVQHCLRNIQRLATRQTDQPTTLNLPAMGDENCIGASERDSAVTSIKSMQKFYNYGSETLATAVCYLDNFLSKFKIKRKYLSCVATAAFFLSTKMNEESEFHPSASDLAYLHRNAWKSSDLKRMEKIILEKLEWKLYPPVTCLAFLEMIHSLLCLLSPSIDDKLLAQLIKRSEILINYTHCAKYQPLTLAVCITHQCLKDAGLSTVLTNYILLHIQGSCQLSDSEVLDCQCAISRQLELYNSHPSYHPVCLPLPKLVPRPNIVTRPSYYCSSDLPVIEEVPYSCELQAEADLLTCQTFVQYPGCPVGQNGVNIQPLMKANQIVYFLPDTSYRRAVEYGSVQ